MGAMPTLQKIRATELKVHFSRHDMSSELDVLFNRGGLRTILEETDYRTLDMVYPFVAGFFEHRTGLGKQTPKTKVPPAYSILAGF